MAVIISNPVTLDLKRFRLVELWFAEEKEALLPIETSSASY
jgi:hypothetical protein